MTHPCPAPQCDAVWGAARAPALPAEGQLDTFFTRTRSSPEGTRAPGGQLSPRGNSSRGHVTSAKIPAAGGDQNKRATRLTSCPGNGSAAEGAPGERRELISAGVGRASAQKTGRPTHPAPRVTEAQEDPPGARRTDGRRTRLWERRRLSPRCGRPARPGAPVGVSPATRHVSKRSLSFPNTYPCGAGSPADIARPAAAGRGSPLPSLQPEI